MANLSIQEIPIGSQLVSTIGANDTPDKNDFEILIIADENITGLTEDALTVSAVDSTNQAISGASLVSLEGRNSVWMATIRPPQTSGILTVTVAANAVSQGNPRTSKSIRISTTFPDADAESPTQLFSTSGIHSIGVTSTRILILVKIGRTFSVKRYTHAGVEQPSEARNVTGTNPTSTKMDIINGDFIFVNNFSHLSRFRDNGTDIRQIKGISLFPYLISITHSHLGFMSVFSRPTRIRAISFDGSDITNFPLTRAFSNITHQGGVIYMSNGSGSDFGVAEITEDDEIHFLKEVNINRGNTDIAIYGDTLYVVSTTAVYTLDIRKYRPIAKNTKTTIYPIFAEAGDTIDLKQFSPDAETIVFDVGYDKQPQLSINVSNKLVVGSGAQTCFVKLKAINRIGATETDSFGFYLIVRQAAAPVWRNVSELTMRAGSSYDLFQLVDAESIEFRSGQTRLAGSSLSNGVFTVGTRGGVAEFTALKGGLSSHIAIAIDVVQGIGVSNPSHVSGYRVEIAGIDVTPDLVGFPSVSETLDPIVINEYRVNEANITLRNESGKYNSNIAGNFWETNGLNTGGFQNSVKIYTEHVNGSENLHFSGVINESFEPIGEVTFKLNCVDISSRLRKARVQGFGTLEKWDALRKQSDKDSYEGIYVPESSLVPMQVGTGKARSDRTELEISRLALPSEGPTLENTGYMTPNEFRTAGGFLPENPLLGFMTEHRSEDVRFLIHQLTINKEVYNTEIDIPGVTVEDPFLLNRGSIAFSVEPTRTTRLPVDWVYDGQGTRSLPNRILVLLSNPEGHIADQLVQYNLSSDSYRVLHTFDKGIAVHRIERRSGTHYYILTSKKIAQDRSARQLPLTNDATGYTYDASAEGSEIKIYHYNTSTGTLTEHVAEDDDYPPQLGIHYWVGFENDLYVDEFEGIRPDYRGSFKWHSNNLYYRYAKDEEFGVARVNTGGTTTKMIGQIELGYQNHLNFAFDINSSGTIYFVYVEGDSKTSTLFIKRRTSNGVETTLLSETRPIGDFNELGLDFGAFLGAHETLFHNNTLYMLVPIQKADLGDGTRSIVNPDVNIEQLTTEKSGERNVTTSTNLNPTNIVLAPGEDIPLRIYFDGSVTGATQNDLRVYGGTVVSFSISSNMIDVTIRPDSKTHHKNIIIDLAEDAVDQGNEGWRIVVDFGTKRSRTKTAGMALYRCDVTAANPSLAVLDKWDFVTRGGCGLTVHAGAVHYVEHPPAATKFKPINPDLDGYWASEEQTQTMGYNVVEESLGALKKISDSGEVEELGNVWFTDRPFNIFPTRMLSIEGALHLCVAYGNADEVLRYNSLASAADNMVHIVYGRTLHYVLPRFQPSGSVYAALAALAKDVNATLSFEKNVIMITDRRPYRALTEGATGTGTADIGFSDANKPFPEGGYLLIGKEILKYTGITGGTFTGVERGVLGSPIADHADDNGILYLDTLIQTEKLGSPYRSITLSSDTNRIFNVIRDAGGVAEVRDEESITLYGERPYTLDLGLTRHEKAWIEEIFKSYLKELSTLQHIVNIQVVPDFSLRLGQIVPFFYKGLIRAMRIVSVRYEARSTHIKGRTLS